MDYKYIEELTERYFEGETTLEEEAVLHAFYKQSEIPAELAAYQPIFAAFTDEMGEKAPGNDFDERVLKLTSRAKLRYRLAPLYRAAAAVAIIVCLSNAIQWSMTDDMASPQGNASGMEAVTEPVQTPLDRVDTALPLISEGAKDTQPIDSLKDAMH